MEIFSIHLGGFELTEPMTAFTDLLLSSFCFFWMLKVGKYRKASNAMASWQFFFLLMGISTFIGVLVHGIRHYQTEEGHHTTWMIMNVISGFAIYFAQMGTMRSILNQSKYRSVYKWIANLQILAYLLTLILMKEFNYNVVKLQVTLGMLPIMIIHFFDYRKGGKGSGWLSGGILISSFSGVFHTFRISISENWFNFNDIAHVFLMVSFSFLGYGLVRRMKSQTASATL